MTWAEITRTFKYYIKIDKTNKGYGQIVHPLFINKQIKGLKSQNLRDNMTPIELTLTTLGEQATSEIIKSSNPSSLPQHAFAAKKGGKIAGNARRQIEKVTGKSVVSPKNSRFVKIPHEIR